MYRVFKHWPVGPGQFTLAPRLCSSSIRPVEYKVAISGHSVCFKLETETSLLSFCYVMDDKLNFESWKLCVKNGSQSLFKPRPPKNQSLMKKRRPLKTNTNSLAAIIQEFLVEVRDQLQQLKEELNVICYCFISSEKAED